MHSLRLLGQCVSNDHVRRMRMYLSVFHVVEWHISHPLNRGPRACGHFCSGCSRDPGWYVFQERHEVDPECARPLGLVEKVDRLCGYIDVLIVHAFNFDAIHRIYDD